jgi:hypothetical protein
MLFSMSAAVAGLDTQHVVALCVCLAGAYYFLFRQKAPSGLIPGVPVVPSNSKTLGFTKFGDVGTLFPFIEAHGPLVQFSSYGRHVLVINDPALARKAWRDVNGKGFFHNPNPAVIETNTFNAQTGPEWHKRR